jgi:hypothetical protein
MANQNQNDKTKAGDAGSPMTSGQPEQFLGEAPAHLAAQGDKAPPMPNARRYFRLHNKGGKMIGKILRIADSVFVLDPKEAAEHPELTEVNQDGSPLTSDKIAARSTGEATGFQKR